MPKGLNSKHPPDWNDDENVNFGDSSDFSLRYDSVNDRLVIEGPDGGITDPKAITPSDLDGSGGSSGNVITTDGTVASWGSSGGGLVKEVNTHTVSSNTHPIDLTDFYDSAKKQHFLTIRDLNLDGPDPPTSGGKRLNIIFSSDNLSSTITGSMYKWGWFMSQDESSFQEVAEGSKTEIEIDPGTADDPYKDINGYILSSALSQSDFAHITVHLSWRDDDDNLNACHLECLLRDTNQVNSVRISNDGDTNFSSGQFRCVGIE